MPKRTRTYGHRPSLAKKMPPLRRKIQGREYSAKDDRVLDWVKCNTDLVLYMVDLLARIGYIEFDPETGTWRGVDYEP